jgi:hypothetical protein
MNSAPAHKSKRGPKRGAYVFLFLLTAANCGVGLFAFLHEIDYERSLGWPPQAIVVALAAACALLILLSLFILAWFLIDRSPFAYARIDRMTSVLVIAMGLGAFVAAFAQAPIPYAPDQVRGAVTNFSVADPEDYPKLRLEVMGQKYIYHCGGKKCAAYRNIREAAATRPRQAEMTTRNMVIVSLKLDGKTIIDGKKDRGGRIFAALAMIMLGTLLVGAGACGLAGLKHFATPYPDAETPR